MSQFVTRAVAGFAVVLAASMAQAQPGPDSVEVRVDSADYEFVDVYAFQPRGTLLTGGIETIATVNRQVAKEVTYTVMRTVIRFVNGRLVIESIPETRTKKVFETVQEEIPLTLPPVEGRWLSTGLGGASVWWINSFGPSGTVVGLGTRIGDTVVGNVTFLASDPTPPSGIYQVSINPVVTSD